jgi:hypothetical protein
MLMYIVWLLLFFAGMGYKHCESYYKKYIHPEIIMFDRKDIKARNLIMPKAITCGILLPERRVKMKFLINIQRYSIKNFIIKEIKKKG